jgi:predicted hotdog family 3-hydroxylacyl-ACP dehydratase
MSPATLDHAGIAARVPHSGSMCLLDKLVAWDDDSITCTAISHHDLGNPLRCREGLLAANAVEYAAQAMALHGVLSAAPGATPQAGFLASVRSVRLCVPRLDQVSGDLKIHAQRLAGDASQAIYNFRLQDATGTLLVEGRATVILNTTP